MRKAPLVFCLLLLAGGLWIASAPTPVSRAAVLELSPRVVNLGEIPLRSKHHIRVVATNAGGAPLVITHVRVSCDCTKPAWRRAPILPGDSTVVTLQFAPTERGAFYKVIRLDTSPEPGSAQAEKPEIVLRGKVY